MILDRGSSTCCWDMDMSPTARPRETCCIISLQHLDDPPYKKRVVFAFVLGFWQSTARATTFTISSLVFAFSFRPPASTVLTSQSPKPSSTVPARSSAVVGEDVHSADIASLSHRSLAHRHRITKAARTVSVLRALRFLLPASGLLQPACTSHLPTQTNKDLRHLVASVWLQIRFYFHFCLSPSLLLRFFGHLEEEEGSQGQMCVILPVDHLACSHTVAIWQHCIDAPRSGLRGLEPCKRVRAHKRPILTRRLCMHCGGPRFFARRGGIADRGTGRSSSSEAAAMKETEQRSDPNDSGYHSDAVSDGEEEEDLVSAGALRFKPTIWRREAYEREMDAMRSARERTPRNRSSSRGRKASWRPNPKRESSRAESPFGTRYADGAKHPYWVPLSSTPETPKAHERARKRPQLLIDTSATRRSSPSQRKGSSLLHPSSPSSALSEESTPPPLPPRRRSPPQDSSAREQSPEPRRRPGSTLLHPSQPIIDLTDSTTTPTYVFPPTPSPSKNAFVIDLPTRTRLDIPHRKNSTLLHPSPPLVASTPSASLATPPQIRLQVSVRTASPNTPPCAWHSPADAPTILSFPPHLPSPRHSASKSQSRRGSIIHSSHSDNESDYGSDSDDADDAGSFLSSFSRGQTFEGKLATAQTQTVRMGRACQIAYSGFRVSRV